MDPFGLCEISIHKRAQKSSKCQAKLKKLFYIAVKKGFQIRKKEYTEENKILNIYSINEKVSAMITSIDTMFK